MWSTFCCNSSVALKHCKDVDDLDSVLVNKFAYHEAHPSFGTPAQPCLSILRRMREDISMTSPQDDEVSSDCQDENGRMNLSGTGWSLIFRNLLFSDLLSLLQHRAKVHGGREL